MPSLPSLRISRSKRHFQAPQQFEDMSASASAKDAILVLQADQIDIAEIQKVSGVPVGIQVILGQREPDSGGVGITLLGVVNWECQELSRAKFRHEWRHTGLL